MTRVRSALVKEVEACLERMADRGLVFDFTDPETDRQRFVLAPPVVGFMEFSLMRVRDDIDQPRVARKLFEYMFEERAFAEAVFAPGEAQIGRTLVQEDVLPEEELAEVLDYERATRLIEESQGGAISLCYCRHKGEHLGHPCEHPQEVCTSLLPSSEFVIRRGFGRPAGVSELKEILAMAKERGLVQIADNVQRNPTYICHCCGCHCGQLLAISRLGLTHAVRTSSRIAAVDTEFCNGCGRCLRRCPIGAISLVKLTPETGKLGRIVAAVDEEICLGCGVCHAACSKEALSFPARKERVLTPESTLERIMMRALEKGSLHHMLFGSEQSKTMAFLHRFLGVVECLPPVHRLLLSKQVKSRFLSRLVAAGKSRGGDVY